MHILKPEDIFIYSIRDIINTEFYDHIEVPVIILLKREIVLIPRRFYTRRKNTLIIIISTYQRP